tara:strand:+ start:253 stop:432 length:180 start_codon:yes stop_codon:yes gene_type:complete
MTNTDKTARAARAARIARTPVWYEVSDLPTLGWFQITEMGEENMYFTLADGSAGFVKLG